MVLKLPESASVAVTCMILVPAAVFSSWLPLYTGLENTGLLSLVSLTTTVTAASLKRGLVTNVCVTRTCDNKHNKIQCMAQRGRRRQERGKCDWHTAV